VSAADQERHHPKSSLAVILSIVLDRHGGFPIEVRDAFERQRPSGNIARVVRGIERDAQHVYRYSEKSGDAQACSEPALSQTPLGGGRCIQPGDRAGTLTIRASEAPARVDKYFVKAVIRVTFR